MKTPEQMAEEFAANKWREWDDYVVDEAKAAFLAGYQAAKDEYKVAIDTYNDVAKQMLEEAVRIISPQDQVADADKVMNSSNNSNGWISVKERLPEDYVDVLWYDPISLQPMRVDMNGALWRADFTNGSVTHWMPLPEAPKGEA
jgi:hypothetical protein